MMVNKKLIFQNKSDFASRIGFANTRNTDLWICKFSPKSCLRSLIRVERQQGIVCPNLVDVFKNDARFWQWNSTMNKNWNFSVHRVELKQQRAFVVDIFFNVFIFDALHLQTPPYPMSEKANPKPYNFHTLVTLFHFFLNYWRSMIDLSNFRCCKGVLRFWIYIYDYVFLFHFLGNVWYSFVEASYVGQILCECLILQGQRCMHVLDCGWT